jgi:hypothetical protein
MGLVIVPLYHNLFKFTSLRFFIVAGPLFVTAPVVSPEAIDLRGMNSIISSSNNKKKIKKN